MVVILGNLLKILSQSLATLPLTNKMMLGKAFLISIVVSLTLLNSSVVSFSVLTRDSSEDEETTEVIEGDVETQLIGRGDEQIASRSRTDFTLRDLFPTYFGEFFEIFVFFMELKWHYEIEDAIAEAGARIDERTNGGDQNHHDNFLLDFAKHYFVNNNTPLWKFRA